MATFSGLRALFTGRASSLLQINSFHISQTNHSRKVNQAIFTCSRNFYVWNRVAAIQHIHLKPSLPSLGLVLDSSSHSSNCSSRSTGILLALTSRRTFYNSSSNSTGLSQKSSTTEKENSKGKGEQSDKDGKKESYWFGKNSWRLGLIFLGGALISWGVGLVSIWGAPELDPDGNEIEDEFTKMSTPLAYLRRTWREMNIFKKKIQDPSREKLLPEPLQYPYMQPPYTLVIELKGILLHPDWTYSTGWRFKKRPGIEYFLNQVGPPLFEVVIYSSEAGVTADPLVNHMDPQGYIMYRLYRDATRYMDGHHVKDLSCLNRDLSKVIMLDCNSESVKLQPNNTLLLKKWSGEDGDRLLLDLAHFLKTIGSSGVEDVRPVLEYYSQFEDPLNTFRENQRKLQEDAELRLKQSEAENKKKSWLTSFKRS